jgi:hypothetical protein
MHTCWGGAEKGYKQVVKNTTKDLARMNLYEPLKVLVNYYLVL